MFLHASSVMPVTLISCTGLSVLFVTFPELLSITRRISRNGSFLLRFNKHSLFHAGDECGNFSGKGWILWKKL